MQLLPGAAAANGDAECDWCACDSIVRLSPSTGPVLPGTVVTVTGDYLFELEPWSAISPACQFTSNIAALPNVMAVFQGHLRHQPILVADLVSRCNNSCNHN